MWEHAGEKLLVEWPSPHITYGVTLLPRNSEQYRWYQIQSRVIIDRQCVEWVTGVHTFLFIWFNLRLTRRVIKSSTGLRMFCRQVKCFIVSAVLSIKIRFEWGAAYSRGQAIGWLSAERFWVRDPTSVSVCVCVCVCVCVFVSGVVDTVSLGPWMDLTQSSCRYAVRASLLVLPNTGQSCSSDWWTELWPCCVWDFGQWEMDQMTLGANMFSSPVKHSTESHCNGDAKGSVSFWLYWKRLIGGC